MKHCRHAFAASSGLTPAPTLPVQPTRPSSIGTCPETNTRSPVITYGT